MLRRALRRIGTGSAAIPIAAWFVLVAFGLVCAALLQLRATYVAHFARFTVSELQRAQLQSQWAAARIEPVWRELLDRRMPSQYGRDATQGDAAWTLRDALGEQPASIDTLAVRVGSDGRLVPDTWRPPSPQADACKANSYQGVLWLARRVLWLDLCAQISATLRHRPGATIEANHLVLLRPLNTQQLGEAVLETQYSLSAMLEEWAPQSVAYWLGLGVQLVTIAVLGSFGWLLLLRRLRDTERGLRSAGKPDALWIPPRANRILDEVGRVEHTVRSTLRNAAVHPRRLQHKNDILEPLRRFIAHEIRTPLQSLMAMHAQSEHTLSYLKRIKYAVDEVLEDASAEDMRDIEAKDLCGFVQR
jgi:hypothetical protein